MKKLITFIFVIFSITNLCAQNKVTDSLKLLLSKEKTDIGRVNLLSEIGSMYGYGSGMRKDDSSRAYAQQALDLSKKIGYHKGEINAALVMVRYYTFSGNYSKALETSLQVKKLIEQFHDTAAMFRQTRSLLMIYNQLGSYKMALKYGKEMQRLINSESYKDSAEIKLYTLQADLLIGNTYGGMNLPDSTIHYWSLCYKNSLKYKSSGMATVSAINIGSLYQIQGKDSLAFSWFRKCIYYGEKSARIDLIAGAKVGIAQLFYKKGEQDSAFYYTTQALQDVKQTDAPNAKIPAYNLLSELYQQHHQYDSAYKYLKMHDILQDSIYNQEKITQAQNLSFNETQNEQQIEQAKKDAQQQYENQLKVYILVAVILIFLIIAFLLLRNLRNKRKANTLLHQKKIG